MGDGPFLNAGDVLIGVLATDNLQTTTGDSNNHLTLSSASGEVWAKLGEYTYSPTAAAAVGATVSVWWTRIPPGGFQVGSLTAGFSAAITKKAFSCYQYQIGAGNLVIPGTLVKASGSGNVAASVSAGAGASGEYLFLRALAGETTAVTFTPTSGFTAWGLSASTGGASAANITVAAEHVIQTRAEAGLTSDPNWVAGDYASIYLAIAEGPPPAKTATLRGTGGGVVTPVGRKNALTPVGGNVYAATILGTTGAAEHAIDRTTPTVLNGPSAQALTYALDLQANVSGLITHVRYYHASTPCPDGTSHVLSIWHNDVNLRLGTVTDAHPNGTGAGWREIALPTPVRVGPNARFWASYTLAIGQYNPRDAAVVPASMTSSLTTIQNRWGGGDAWPSSTTGDYLYVDVVFRPTTAPAGYWRLGEANGAATAVSALGDGNNGGYVGNKVTTAGAIADGNSALVVPLNNCAVSVSSAARVPALDLITDTVTTEAWVNLNGSYSAANAGIIAKATGTAYMRLEAATGKLQFVKDRIQLIVTSTQAVPLTGWHHVVCTKTGATVKQYIDGVDVTGTITNATLVSNSGGFLFFGSDNNANFGGSEPFVGYLDEIAVYNRVLTPAEVLAHYNAGTSFAPGFGVTGGGVMTLVGVAGVAPELHSGTVMATGGGVIALTGVKFEPELHAGTATMTGGGTATLAATKRASRTLVSTGGGVLALTAPRKGAVRTLALTGGGVVTSIRVKRATNSVVATGGGLITLAYTVGVVAVEKFGTVTATGGGVAAITPVKGAVRPLVLTGGGVLTVTRVARRSRALVLTGGGTMTPVAAHARRATAVATGGGVVSVSRVANRRSAVVLTGGGVIALGRAAARRTQIAVTGGGAIVAGQKTARQAAYVFTGGGRLLYTYAAGANVSAFVLATGGGVITITGTASWPRLKRSYSVLI